MIYVTSDIHGCFEKYKKLLGLLNLKEDDVLYILGDMVDRGPDGLRILLDAAKHENIIMLRGNHDESALAILKQVQGKSSSLKNEKFIEAMALWMSDGGEVTFEEYKRLNDGERKAVIDILNSLPLFEELEIGSRKFFLAHTVPGKKQFKSEENWTASDFTWGKPEYEKIYDENITIVTGHTPTGLIDENYVGKIWKGNNHIAIDCGAVYGNPLGCLCLDTMQETYVE